MNQAFTIVIPARFGSSRLIGKPLLLIGEKPMVQVVWEQACLSRAERIIVATDDIRIMKACASFGAEAVMTLKDHTCGTERTAEVISTLNLPAEAIVVNVQGDEPCIPPILIDQVAANLCANSDAALATLAEPITDISTLFSPNVVKVTTDIHGFALTFSRSVLPWARDDFAISKSKMPSDVPYRRHVGIYAYRASFLHDFVSWGPCDLERIESLEQLRAIWHGARVHVGNACKTMPPGVDTSEDLDRVRHFLSEKN